MVLIVSRNVIVHQVIACVTQQQEFVPVEDAQMDGEESIVKVLIILGTYIYHHDHCEGIFPYPYGKKITFRALLCSYIIREAWPYLFKPSHKVSTKSFEYFGNHIFLELFGYKVYCIVYH